MNRILKLILVFFFITNCSFTSKSKFWTNSKIIEEKQDNKEEVFKKDKTLNVEFNPTLEINFTTKASRINRLNSLNNSTGRSQYKGNLKNVSKFKFSKIKNFYQYDPKISFNNNDIIFFDDKGSIIKFDNNSNLIWKKNYYTKTEKKQKPILFFANNNRILIVTDNIAKYYAINIDNGNLLWSKNSSAPFNSQIKIYKDKFFVIDFENVLRAYSIKNGKEIWNVKTENSLIKSQKKLSIIIVDKKIYFNNSLGDISSVDIESGELIWQTPTQNTLNYDETFSLKTSEIIADKKTMYFSNNKNQFFALDLESGRLNWQQKINSNLRSTLVDNYLFTVSLEGYLMVIDKTNGNIIRVSDIFKNIKPKKRKKIKSTGFVMGSNNIYLTTDNGRLFIIETKTGLIKNIIKLDNKKILRPSILDKNLFIVTDNSIIKLN